MVIEMKKRSKGQEGMKMQAFTRTVINLAYAYGGRVQAMTKSISAEFEKKDELVRFLTELEKRHPGYQVKEFHVEARQVHFALPEAA